MTSISFGKLSATDKKDRGSSNPDHRSDSWMFIQATVFVAIDP
jgi:hypothetical protein